jgi:hypothetical protein
MTEARTTEFTPITTQEEFNERIKSRLAREREKWEKGSDAGDLKAQLEAKDEEIIAMKQEHHLEDARRAVTSELATRGVTDEGRIERVMKLVDLEAVEVRPGSEIGREDVLAQIDGVAKDLPELVRPRGAGSRGSHKPVGGVAENKPLTRQEVEKMGPEEINSRWDTVKAFLAGERS